MANQRDLLKEAIADAKAVKETAIANAKASLEESFTPHLKSMLSAKLQEMDEDDDVEEGYGKKDMDEAKKEEMDEAKKEEIEEETLNLDELLEDEDKEDMDEAKDKMDEAEDEEEEMESDEEEGSEDPEAEEDEEIDLEDMSEDDLKSFIEDVISDMVEAGELEPGEEVEMDSEEEEMDDEIEMEDDSEEMMERKQMNESEGFNGSKSKAELVKHLDDLYDWRTTIKRYRNPFNDDLIDDILVKNNAYSKLLHQLSIALSKASEEEGIEEGQFSGDQSDVAGAAGGLDAIIDMVKKSPEMAKKLMSALKELPAGAGYAMRREGDDEDLKEALETINSLKTELQEINLLNAKLLYTNKIFKGKNLTESKKVKVLKSFDKAETVKEAKMIFETLVDNLGNTKKTSMMEGIKSSASKASGITESKNQQPIVENQVFERMKKLAFHNTNI